MKIILASKSPRRKDLMDLLHIEYEVIASEKEEIYHPKLTLEEQSKQIAYQKAKEVFDEVQGDRIVIGADTLVLKNGMAYGKPKDNEEAMEMINMLKNSKHQVITSYVILIQTEEKYKEIVDSSITNVYVKDISEEEIKEWLNKGKHMDRAGAYGIQDEFSVHIEKIEGSYATVLGLPIEKIYDGIKQYIK